MPEGRRHASACEAGPYCGDGVTQLPDEQCDDGGTDPCDGCSPSCQLETPVPSSDYGTRAKQ